MCKTAETLSFKPVTIEDYEWIYRYTSAFGESSCQHSPVSMWSLSEKYGDTVCERNGFLYTLRERLCDNTYRVYLAPLGGGDKRTAYSRIFADAKAHGKKVKFYTLTETAAKFLEEAFTDRFLIEEERDMAEYIYRSEAMATFSGPGLRKRRGEVHTFWNHFGDRASTEEIREENVDEVLSFERAWVEKNKETHDSGALMRDVRMAERQLEQFDALRLSGILMRIDGRTAGICYGTNLGNAYDVIVEKADRTVPHIYKVLRQESAKQCAAECDYINMEEDVGVMGLRALKNAYHPTYILQKFIAVER